MALNYIWVAFFLIAFVVALIKLLFLGDTEVFTKMVESTFTMAETSVNIAIYLIGVMTLWLGIELYILLIKSNSSAHFLQLSTC